MGMSYKCPLGKVVVNKSRGSKKTPEVKIPEVLRLPDGRTFNTKELLELRSKNKEYINLHTRRKTKAVCATAKPPKYTIDERKWAVEATPEAVADKFGFSLTYAKTFKAQSREIVSRILMND